MKSMKFLFLSLFVIVSSFAQAQEADKGIIGMGDQRRDTKREIIQIPDVGGYKVLKCDFHTHTVFSDGLVWPSIRLQEAWEEGLDAIAITDHIEYQPHSVDVKTNHNRAYELLKGSAEKNNVILIKGTEITRNTPPGHFNAIFIGDASGYIEDKANTADKEAVMKAVDQNAFVFWNHPGWRPNIEGSYDWIAFVDELKKTNALNGIEVFNGFQFYQKALDWCVDKNLTVMGTSDIHNLVQHDYNVDKEYVHRTMTLVMAKDRTPESIRKALNEGRTVAWSSKLLAGKEENVRALFNACVKFMPIHFVEKTSAGKSVNYREVHNNSSLYFELELRTGNGTKSIILPPQSVQLISADAGQNDLTYEVVNTYVRSNKHLEITVGQ